METIGFSKYTIMLSVNNDHFTSTPIWMPFISFSCLIAGARTSNTMLNKRGESELPCLVLDVKENTFSFCPLGMMLSTGSSYMIFIMVSYVPSIPTSMSVFVINGCWILSHAFSAFIDMTM